MLNGLAAAPLVALILTAPANREVMGSFVIPNRCRFWAGAATFVMSAVGVAVFCDVEIALAQKAGKTRQEVQAAVLSGGTNYL